MARQRGITDPISELTEPQRACLRLAAKGYTSKEIARSVGLTPQTVDQYMSRAINILGAADRREAARLHAQVESDEFSLSELRSTAVASHAAELADKLPAESPSFSQAPQWLRDLMWLPPIGGQRHELGWKERIRLIARISIAAAVAFLVLATFTSGAIRILGN